MNLPVLIGRSLVHHRRAHLGLALGLAVATAVLTGALAVGDSVRASLRAQSQARLGHVQLAISSGNRFFRAALAQELAADLRAPATAAITLPAVAIAPDTQLRVAGAVVLGVDEAFWRLSPAGRAPAALDDDGVILNRRLARQLNLAVGQRLLVRLENPGPLPRDAPLSTTDDAALALPLVVRAIADDTHLADWSPAVTQTPPANAFVSRSLLETRLEQPGRANTLLLAGPSAAAQAALRRAFTLDDAQLALRFIDQARVVELHSPRVFLDPPLIDAALAVDSQARGVFTYFVNALRHGERATPYSMVAAIGPLAPVHDPPPPDADGVTLPTITISTWLAEDLAAAVGDVIELDYFVLGPGRALEERTRSFSVERVVPMAGPLGDPTLMPAFPGLAEHDNCRDWDPGFAIDLDQVRDKDQSYWEQHRGTPKATVSLAQARDMWANRFGDLTAVRFSVDAAELPRLARHLAAALDPSAVGLVWHDVRAQARRGAAQAMDFSQLFLGFSFFLIAAALLLTVLLVVMGIQERQAQVGVLLALGFTPGRVRLLLLAECLLPALAGVLAGAAGAGLYTLGALWGLGRLWRQFDAPAALHVSLSPATLLTGTAAGFVGALVTLSLTLARQARQPARALLSAQPAPDGGAASPRRRHPLLKRVLLAGGLASAAVLAMASGADREGRAAAGAFFLAGTLWLGAALALCGLLLGRLARARQVRNLSLTTIGLRSSTRRRGRSLAVVALLAAGTFLVTAVGANRYDPAHNAHQRRSGTGGFALFGELSLPLVHDLNTSAGRAALGLDDAVLQGVSVASLRSSAGDEASCFNLNRPQRPRLWAVDPALLDARQAFSFMEARVGPDPRRGWMLLEVDLDDGAVPAIVDQNTLVWALQKRVGDTIDHVDGRGRPMRLRIVGSIATSILQGGLLLSERNFLQHFPDHSGYQTLLVDAPPAQVQQVRSYLSGALADLGLEIIPAPQRLALLSAVEGVYLSIFQALGGLGVILGSLGLGVVVLRNTLERCGELALLRAVGFSRRQLLRLVLAEHWLLVTLGLVAGAAAALVAVWPALRAGARLPALSLALSLAAIAASGFLWTYIAARLALRGQLLAALRNT